MSAVPEADRTICDIVRAYGQTSPHAPALVEDGKEPLTYGALSKLMDRVRQSLNGIGFGREDRIAIVAPSDATMAALITGIWGCATAVPMNPALSIGEFSIYLRDLKIKALAVHAGIDTAARDAAQAIGLPIIEVQPIESGVAGMFEIESTCRTKVALRPGAAKSDDLASVLATSGTTSHYKIVPTNQRQLLVRDSYFARAFQLTPADRCLNLMPLFHVHGLYCSLGATLYSGGSLVTLSDFSADGFFHLIESASPTWYTGSYTFQHTILAAASRYAAAIKKSNLRLIRTASGHLDPQIADDLEAVFDAPVIMNYGCTELSPICVAPLPPAVRKRGTVGVPAGGAIAIMGPERVLLPPGHNGEVVVDTRDVFTGYENDPAANAAAFVDGWFRTGDEGVMDEDGYLRITGRIKDIINRGGEKITPSEIDDALASHPDVAAAVTFPVPHGTLGQEVVAAVVPARNAELTDQKLIRFLRSKLAPFKLPRRFIFVDKIPKGPTGKIQRRMLAETFGLAGSSGTIRQVRADDRPATVLEAKLQGIWAEVLALEHVGLEDDFFLLGGDSLQAVDLFLEIEKKLGRRLPRAVLFEAGTVAEMAARIEMDVPSSCIVPIQPKGENPPFFCVHDQDGHVLNFRDLARHLGTAQPFYGIQCLGLDGMTVPFTRMEDMARHYLGEIRKIQPSGPYYIGGYSFGGRAAFAIAQKLRAEGEEVALLALLDTYYHLGQKGVGMRQWLARHRERMARLHPRKIPGYLAVRVQNVMIISRITLRTRLIPVLWRIYEKLNRPVPRFLHWPAVGNDIVRRNFFPHPYEGDAVLFQAELPASMHREVHEGWRNLVLGGLEIRPVPGRHSNFLEEPHVRTLAEELADCLAERRERHSPSARIPDTGR